MTQRQVTASLHPALSVCGLDPSSVSYVICTSGKLGQTGNLNLFTSAIHLVAGDVCKGDTYQLHGFREVVGMHASALTPLIVVSTKMCQSVFVNNFALFILDLLFTFQVYFSMASHNVIVN